MMWRHRTAPKFQVIFTSAKWRAMSFSSGNSLRQPRGTWTPPIVISCGWQTVCVAWTRRNGLFSLSFKFISVLLARSSLLCPVIKCKSVQWISAIVLFCASHCKYQRWQQTHPNSLNRQSFARNSLNLQVNILWLCSCNQAKVFPSTLIKPNLTPGAPEKPQPAMSYGCLGLDPLIHIHETMASSRTASWNTGATAPNAQRNGASWHSTQCVDLVLASRYSHLRDSTYSRYCFLLPLAQPHRRGFEAGKWRLCRGLIDKSNQKRSLVLSDEIIWSMLNGRWQPGLICIGHSLRVAQCAVESEHWMIIWGRIFNKKD